MSNFSQIPIIDLSLASSPSTFPSLLRDLGAALTDIGFLYVSNHGVPPSAISDLVAQLPVLFSLPDDAKRAIALEKSPHFLGYSAVGTEVTAGARDKREQVEFATELRAGEGGGALWERLRGPNQWPAELPQLRRATERYMAELTALGDRFLRLVALALSLPAETFLPYLSDQHRLKLVHYPPSLHSAQGVGPHKDSSGWWTFLLQASPETRGLQVLNKQGGWVDVPPVRDTFVVNIGQAFEAVTRGVCRATTHRVVLGEGGGGERYSVPFFQGVRGGLTREEVVGGELADYFDELRKGEESREGEEVDSPFERGGFETWGEAQLRTKIRSHRENGRRFYADVYEKYVGQ